MTLLRIGGSCLVFGPATLRHSRTATAFLHGHDPQFQPRRYLNRLLFDPSEIAFGTSTGTGGQSLQLQTLNNHHQRQRSRSNRRPPVLNLNRFLFDCSEIDSQSERDPAVYDDDQSVPTVTLPKDDYRTIHAAKILSLQNGDSLRAGIVLDSDVDKDDDASDASQYSGYVTDEATIEWIPEGKIKKACPTKNGDPPGSLRIALTGLIGGEDDAAAITKDPPVSLILALPRPLQLQRILPMISQMGVDQLVLTAAQKVPKDYFGSHLFRRPEELRRLLIEGLCQCGDVKIPKVTVAKRFRPFMEDELDELFPKEKVARVIAHPQRAGQTDPPLRMRDIVFPEDASQRSVVIAVGPEGGWSEPYELDMFESFGFQQITLGQRVLRSDVAVVSLLSLAHDVCHENSSE